MAPLKGTKTVLHSDALQAKYGPVHAIVMRHDRPNPAKPGEERIREAKILDQQGIMRTYALTFFSENNTQDAPIAEIDKEIADGGLIGETFRKHGYSVVRNILEDFAVAIPPWMRNDFHTHEKIAQARLIEFHTEKGGRAPVFYGTILEIYSPDFETPNASAASQKEPVPALRYLHEKINSYLSLKR